MPFIQIDETQFPLGVGETTIGTGGDAMIRVPGPDLAGVRAIVRVGSDRSVAILRSGAAAVGPGSEIRVNGVALGAEPTPLLHGDKIELVGQELLFGDEKKGGGTQFLSGSDVRAAINRRPADASTTPRPTASTGGRLVSLVDGREYQVPDEGVVFGRDAGCDIVVPGEEISRHHARIIRGPDGYVLEDTSTNGVLVNGQRVQGTQLLGRGDVLRLGKEDFRFYADVPQPDEVPLAVPQLAVPQLAPTMVNRAVRTPPPAAAVSPPAAAAVPPPAAVPSPAPPRKAAPMADSAGTRPPLATLEIVNEGVLKGQRFEVRVPVVNVGRGPHNDIIITDDSVSDSHAKLLRRDDGWHVVDMSSTNGTYVGGRRVEGESPLVGAPDLRFGGIKLIFRPSATSAFDAKGTRAIAGPSADQLRKAAEYQRKAAQPPRRPVAPVVVPTPPPETPRGLPVWVWLVAFLLVVALVVFFFQGTR